MIYDNIKEKAKIFFRFKGSTLLRFKFIIYFILWFYIVLERKFIRLFKRLNIRYSEAIMNRREIILNILGSKMILPTEDKGLSRELIRYGIRESNVVELMKKELKPEMNVIEAGANIGYYVLLEAKEAKKIYAIEPNPKCFEYLKRNIQLNKLKNVELFNIAVGDKIGTLPFIMDKRWNLSQVAMNNEKNTKNIKVETLDNIFRNKKIDLIRMDVEGYELNILKGAKEIIKNNPEIKLLIEFHSGILIPRQRKEFVEFCKENDLIVKHFFLRESPIDKEYSKSLKNLIDAVPWAHQILLEKQGKN